MKAWVMLTALLVLSVCVSSGTQVQQTSIDKFEKGITTQRDIEKTLGTPQMHTANGDGTHSIGYLYTHAHAKAASYIPIVGLFAGGAKGNNSIVTFKFGADNKLIDYQASSSDIDVRTGIGAGTGQSQTPQ